ncbi:MAG: pyridoxamine 5'-phosphate oxidase family protein [Roseicyclus sp.]
MTDTSPSGMFDTIWAHLNRGLVDRDHPARHPTLATIGPDGPELRTLVLRGVDRSLSVLEFHTDRHSPKVDQIAGDPRVALHIWLPHPRLQLRLRAVARIEPGDPHLFARLPSGAQANYGGPAPGMPATPDPYEPDATRFTRIICTVIEIDALWLTDPHQRALFTASDGWTGRWITP